ncbi:MAG: AMP nucleosidase, partial [Rhodobacteraceae bacterium]
MFGDVSELETHDDAESAVERLRALYDRAAADVRGALAALKQGADPGRVEARYPFVGVRVGREQLDLDARHAYGVALDAGVYGTTVTRPDLFDAYLREQIGLVTRRHGAPVVTGVGPRRMPLPFVVENSMIDLDPERAARLQDHFAFPDLRRIDDRIANGDVGAGPLRPLALFEAERVDYSLARLRHYTGAPPERFQSFVLLTNYQRYVDRFLDWGAEVLGTDGWETLVEPGDVVTTPDGRESGARPAQLPQMPAYHLTRANGDGITMVNIGVGPSNAKTITDHLAVLRPHCWLMVG